MEQRWLVGHICAGPLAIMRRVVPSPWAEDGTSAELCFCPRLSFFALCVAFADVSPRHRIQNISRFVWKQANVASELWEKLTARCVDQHRHIERTLEQLLEIKGAMEELSTTLDQAESVRETWEPIGDLFIDSLPEHIQSTKVLVAPRFQPGQLGVQEGRAAGHGPREPVAEGSHLGTDILLASSPSSPALCLLPWARGCSSSRTSSLP